MPNQVVMPQLGESVVEGTITRWLKEPGETVEEYEPLLEVNTDKVDSEIPSPFTGKLLEILVPEGTTVQAGEVLALIGVEGEETTPAGRDEEEPTKTQPAESAVEKKPVEAAPETQKASIPTQGQDGDRREGGLGFISPVVGRMAAEHNIDLNHVQGTGLGGRITKKDIQTYLTQLETTGQPVVKETPPEAIPTPEETSMRPDVQPREPVEKETLPSRKGMVEAVPGEVLPLNTVRRAIADHMVMSKRTSPHVTTIMEADLARVVAHRQANKEAYARDGANLTYTAYIVAASVAALKKYPLVNSSWSEEGIILHPQINIGMATSLGEQGLIVPVLKNADELSLLGLARTINDLANRARAKKLQPDEVKGGTFTITNHGTSGSLFATPIINQPQCAILGVGAIQKRVVVTQEDAIVIRPMAYLSLTFDHRILDGAVADYFLGWVVKSLEIWG
jgi:pyruvate/2-oxoglutarate dehydrogenase complex dihydrolipoamide acyltransferase (E2) component